MDPSARPRRGSYGFGIVLIAMGLLFLASNLRPSFDPWRVLWKYWPLLLIMLGLAKLWDHMRSRNDPQSRSSSWISGGLIAVVVFAILIGASMHSSGASNPVLDDKQSVEKQNAQTATVKIDMGAGQLNVDGGSTRLLDTEFKYDEQSGKPRVDYSVSGTSGNLNVSQQETGGMHLGRNENTWTLHFGDLPLDLNVNMGAGQMNLDLTGERKQNFNVDVQGGVGEAVIRLPHDVGVEIRADGGIGSIDTSGLHKEGGRWVNDAWGKSPITIHMNVEGGIGEIRLTVE